jgi:hypothetical protein
MKWRSQQDSNLRSRARCAGGLERAVLANTDICMCMCA